ncbi:dihydrolipoamide acetyltransferase family protein [Sulfuricystis multivorans]|uniref:dihydrolipoamide acetyltransferase family protein n=1 Tax=Sulfuricystis multivorans TaxID=2211108 RepID=UPI000F84529D|nr:dihydrolipoamide acetyltransferase family protein [Sulfuricystis multivorans]
MIEFKLPALGADMDEGTLLEWKVKPGDRVEKGQVIAIVDTAKAAIDVESWQAGIVHRLIAEPGQKMPVGTVMALLLEPGETPPPAEPVTATTQTGTGESPDVASSTGALRKVGAGGNEDVPPGADSSRKVGAGGTAPPAVPEMGERRRISPAARKRAAELGIDVGSIAGSGPQGAVTLEDVEAVAQSRMPSAAQKPTTDRRAEMRKTIAAAMSRSKREIPHYYVSEDIPLPRMLAWLQESNAARPLAERLLPAAVLLKAVARALADYPELNGHYLDGGFRAAEKVHLGVAISLREGGLIAPALLDADTKPLTKLMQELADLVRRTRAGTLKRTELTDATITVTNLGDQGSHGVFGVITPPQVALVGFGRIAERPWAENGGLKVLPVVTASLSADHRVSDGHRGALFLRTLSDLLQQPEELAK